MVYIESINTDRDTTTLHQRLIEIMSLLQTNMSNEQQLSLHGHGGNDEDCDIPATKHFHRGDEESDEESNKQRQKDGINEIDEATIKKSEAQNTKSIIGMIDTFDRPASANKEGGYAKQGFYASGFENKPGKRIPKTGYIAEAGIGRARAEAGVFEAEARGPNASIGAEASAARLSAGAMARAEIASASAKAGPLGVKVGLGFDTGASVGFGGVEVKLLGIGFSIGPKIGLSFLNSEVSLSLF